MASVAVHVVVFPDDTFEGTDRSINCGFARIIPSRNSIDHSVSILERFGVLDGHMRLVGFFSFQVSYDCNAGNIFLAINAGNYSFVSADINLNRCPCDRITLVIVVTVGVANERTCGAVIHEVAGNKLARLAVRRIERDPCINVGGLRGINRPLLDLHLIVGSNTGTRTVLKCRKCIQHHGISDVVHGVIADVHGPADIVRRLHEFAVRDLGD